MQKGVIERGKKWTGANIFIQPPRHQPTGPSQLIREVLPQLRIGQEADPPTHQYRSQHRTRVRVPAEERRLKVRGRWTDEGRRCGVRQAEEGVQEAAAQGNEAVHVNEADDVQLQKRSW